MKSATKSSPRNKSFGRWAEILHDEAIAAATLERLLDHVHVLSLKGD